jgi:predicted transposase YbfD/YdcC
MGTQTKIAQQIVEREGDYVLALKGNQGNLCKDVEQLFAHAQSVDFVGIKHDFHQTIDKGHGRIEIRRCWTMEQTEFLLGGEKWAKLTSICMIQAERRLKDKTEYETRYYISSLPSDAQKLSQSVRSHWLIENSLHWVLDLAFNEDACRIRKDFGRVEVGYCPKPLSVRAVRAIFTAHGSRYIRGLTLAHVFVLVTGAVYCY